MENKTLPLTYWYGEALKSRDIHACTSMDLSAVRVESLFEENNSLKFIKQYLGQFNSTFSKKNTSNKLSGLIGKITPFRAQHTVASFLLGIALKEELTLDIRNWVRLYNTYSSDSSFGFFWSLICLTHDIAYTWEQHPSKYLSSCRTVNDFCSENNIQFNLLDKSSKAQLIENYYLYRTQQHKKVDHGITGAILIYDALLSFYEENHKNSAARLCGLRLNKKFPDFCLTIAETIALHNMWRAESDNISIYREYHLDELIPDGTQDHIVDYRDNTLLFLLGLIDSIDPIKAFCNTEGRSAKVPVNVVLNEFLFGFTNRSKSKKISLEFNHPVFSKKYTNTILGLKDWLSVDVKTTDNSAEILLNQKANWSTYSESRQAG